MNGLESEFGEEITFIRLNVDDESTLPMRQQYNLVQRSQYLFLAPDGTEIRRWFGPLSEAEMLDALFGYLADNQ
ncbi:MAG: hypothetical protein KC615_14740 [Anaerolineae bacterium]|nr:hypothetical protein [Anaerolineae bacterium]MCA9894244.1 hypothetical protein [Anaerolineae bacterium]